MKAKFLPLLLVMAACSSGGAIMTMNSFYDIPIGTTESDLVASAGKPYKVHKKKDGVTEYIYIERVKAGGRDLQERRYIIVCKEGKVVSKHINGSSPPPYLFDSYEMQTTQIETSPEE